MAEVRFYKLKVLPTITVANSIYLIESEDEEYYDIYSTSLGNVLKPVGNANLVNSLILAALATTGISGSIALELGEVLTGTLDGSNATFTTLEDFVPDKLNVFINGILQDNGVGYTTLGTKTIVFTDSPEVVDVLQANYIKQITV